jgi:hypothetical protein
MKNKIIHLSLQTKILLMALCLGFSLYPTKVKAQFFNGNFEDFKLIKSLKLIVVKEVEDPEVLKSIEKEKHIANPVAAVAEYKKYLAEYNQNMKEAVEKCWKYSNKGIEFKTLKEVMVLFKEKNKEYALMYCRSNRYNPDGFLSYDVFRDSQQDENRAKGGESYCVFFVVTLIEKPKTNIYSCSLTNILPSKADIALGIFNMELASDIKTRKEEGAKVIRNDRWYEEFGLLPKTTLLIWEDLFDPKFDKGKIASIYPYKFEVVSKEKYDQLVLARTPGYAMVYLQPILNNGIMQYVVDLENGKRMTCCSPRQNGYKRLITKNSFEAFLEKL